MCAVHVGEVVTANAAVKGGAHEGFAFFFAQAGVIGLAIAAADAGAHDDARDFEAGFAESDGFEGIEFSDGRVRGQGEPGCGKDAAGQR
jgi:hypothetical protein